MAGATLALLVTRFAETGWKPWLPRWTPLLLGMLLLGSASPYLPALNYARPYLAAAMIGTSLYAVPAWMERIWASRPARYVADISYALYIFHGMLMASWLGGADASTLDRYLRRPFMIAATFALAHLSTYHYERHWMALGRRLIRRFFETPHVRAAEQAS